LQKEVAVTNFLFWDVDTQNDFMLPEGKLYVPGAEKIIPSIQRLNRAAADAGVQVISSTDAHQASDPEFQTYPPHCLAETEGQKKVEGTLLEGEYVIPNRKIALPSDLASFPQIIIEKQDVNVFTNPNLEDLLQRVARGKQIILYGVVTEICVDLAARGLIQRGYGVNLVRDAVRHLDEKLGQATIAEITRSGCRLLTTDEAIEAVRAHSSV